MPAVNTIDRLDRVPPSPRYLSTHTDGREVDFVIVDRRRPVLCVECKWADTPVDKSLRDFKVRFPDCDAWQLSATGTKDYVNPDGVRVAPALTLLRTLI